MIKRLAKRRQSGLTTVEFAIVGAVFLLILFGIIEFGRFLMVLGSLNEATRRGARVAAVCPLNHPGITRVTVFNDPNAADTGSPVVNGLTTANVVVQYLDRNFDVVAVTDPLDPATIGTISRGYVRVRITNFQHRLLIPLFDFLPDAFNPVIDTPAYQTTIPAESLGVVPADDANNACFWS